MTKSLCSAAGERLSRVLRRVRGTRKREEQATVRIAYGYELCRTRVFTDGRVLPLCSEAE